MVRSLRIAAALGLVASLVLGTGSVAAATGHHKIVDSGFIGLPSAGLVLAGVAGAGHAWAIADGNAKLFEDGRVKLDVEGLVLTPEGTNPVANGRIVVSCNGGGAGNVVQSGLVPLSIPDGNAAFHGRLPIPSPCLDPVVFFASPGGAWFAAAD